MCLSLQLIQMKLNHISSNMFVLEKYFDHTENPTGNDNDAMTFFFYTHNISNITYLWIF